MRLNKTMMKLWMTSMTIAFGCTTIATPAFAATSNPSDQPYVVQQNFTLWSLSEQLHMPVSALVAANPTVNPLDLKVGTKIDVPSARVSTPTAPAIHAAPTAAVPTVTTSAGQQIAYSKEIACSATAYTAAPSENGYGAVDYFGNPLKTGTIAVDPSVIPLGSTVYVTGYSFNGLEVGGMICHATDTGSGIQGNRIDMFVPTNESAASQFGIQSVKVYVLN